MFIYGIKFEGKIMYVGQTLRDPSERWRQHRNNAKAGMTHCRKLYTHLRKNRANDFEKYELAIIDECKRQKDLDAREKYWIKFFKTMTEGLNGSPGGQRIILDRLTNIAKKVVNSDGQEFESISNAARSLSGSKDSSARDHIRRALKAGIRAFGTYWRYEESDFIRLSPRTTGRPGNARHVTPVECLKTGKKWKSMKECSQELNIPYVTIQKWIEKNASPKSEKYSGIHIVKIED